ncbi:hypothetical protein PoB_002356400 [Plakobranchus ocellatus]|uniref:Uncharacterized protein n=1 Tax=Plakobranchus ocellatus TaxID=259542 RepID=A0AAV3ZT46_9GAST|nr:hypothetical protein PoB_002356400 [Plakobranchus ocellatus]
MSVGNFESQDQLTIITKSCNLGSGFRECKLIPTLGLELGSWIKSCAVPSQDSNLLAEWTEASGPSLSTFSYLGYVSSAYKHQLSQIVRS